MTRRCLRQTAAARRAGGAPARIPPCTSTPAPAAATPQALTPQAARAVGLDEVGHHGVHEHGHMAEHVVEDVGLLQGSPAGGHPG